MVNIYIARKNKLQHRRSKSIMAKKLSAWNKEVAAQKAKGLSFPQALKAASKARKAK